MSGASYNKQWIKQFTSMVQPRLQSTRAEYCWAQAQLDWVNARLDLNSWSCRLKLDIGIVRLEKLQLNPVTYIFSNYSPYLKFNVGLNVQILKVEGAK